MALAENPPSEKQTPETTTKPDKKQEKPLTKVIIRRLPPSISQEDFLSQISPVPDHDYIYTVCGDASLGENSFSRVYLNFCSPDDIYLFKEKFDGYVFVDGKGHEYPAVVEYSSFQKVPKRKKPRPDPKIGTIESDPIYLEFLESLKEQPTLEEKPEYSYQPSTGDKNEVTTPLLDYLKQRKLDKLRIREEKREERRKKEIERKKMRDDDRRKRLEEKVSPKNKPTPVVLKETKTETEEKSEEPPEPSEAAPTTFHKKERTKYEDRKPAPKPKYQNKYEDKKEYKNRRDDYREYHRKYEDTKKFEPKEYTKKVKKYSERREERKMEASKAKEKKDEASAETAKPDEVKEQKEERKEKPSRHERKMAHRSEDNSDGEVRQKNKENDPRVQRRIRNKDRPAMVLYKPGMLRKKSVDNDKDSKGSDKDSKEDKGDKPEKASSNQE